MSVGLASDGYYGSGSASSSGDTNPPVLVVISPTNGVAPGAPGGFSSDFRIASQTPIIVEITDADPGVAHIFVDAGDDAIFSNGSFRGAYVDLSSIETISGGFRLTILPTGGWPSGVSPMIVSFLPIDFFAIDGNNNTLVSTLIWQLPASANATTTPVTPVGSGVVDHVAEAIDRLIWQFKE